MTEWLHLQSVLNILLTFDVLTLALLFGILRE